MNWVRRGLIAFFLLIGLILLFNNQIASFILNQREEVTRESIINAKKISPNISYDEIKSLSSLDILRAKLSNNKANYIGLVSIPDIGLTQPIVNELSNYALSVGAAIYYDNMEMGKDNYVLASHFSYTGETELFSPLYYNINKDLKDKEAYLTDLEYLYTYKISTYKVVDITQTSYIQQNKASTLTLFTCNYYSEDGRIILQGELVKKEKIDDSMKDKINNIF